MFRSDNPEYWAEKPWWNDLECVRSGKLDAKVLQTAIGAMTRHFDRHWWDDLMADPGQNIVMSMLLPTGLLPLASIVSLGSALDALSTAQGFPRKVKELRSKGLKSEKTLFEVSVASAFATAGCQIEFPKECTTPVPDIRASRAGNHLAIECKALDGDEWERWGEALTYWAIRNIPKECDGSPIVVQIEFDPRLSEIRTQERSDSGRPIHDYSNALAEAIVLHLKAETIEVLARRPSLPHEFVVNGVATVRLLPHDCGEHSSVSGCEISPTAQLRRILQNGLFKAYLQLPVDVPGIVVVKNEHMPNPALARLAFDVVTSNGPPELQRVRGLCVMPQQYAFHRRQSIFLPNRHVEPSPGIDAMVNTFVSAVSAEVY